MLILLLQITHLR